RRHTRFSRDWSSDVCSSDLAKSDYFVMPSRSESYPLIIGEVMGLEIPIISTNVGGVPEMIAHEVDGYLVNFDEDEIYEAMKRFRSEERRVGKEERAWWATYK